MAPFCDLPDIERFRLRDAIEDLGGDIESYQGDAVQVALPTEWRRFITAADKLGLVLVHGSRWLFPLGSDNPPATLRHDGSYPGSKGFWMYAKFVVPDYCPM